MRFRDPEPDPFKTIADDEDTGSKLLAGVRSRTQRLDYVMGFTSADIGDEVPPKSLRMLTKDPQERPIGTPTGFASGNAGAPAKRPREVFATCWTG